MKPRARSLVIGLDGAGLDLVRRLGRERLPYLHGLMERGVCAPLDTVVPHATLPNWTTFLTALDPGGHGVFDFTTRQGYAVRFTAGSVREAPTLAARLDRLGKRCACLFFPATYPPERLERGVFISGWDAPVAFSADPSFVWPTALHGEILARFGPQRFDDVDEFAADDEDWHAALPDALIARIERRTELARWLLERERWDLFALYFGESDTASHHLWSLFDERSPRHPAGTAPFLREGLPRVYQALDRAVGELVEAAGGDAVEVTIVSDHGSGGSSDRVLYLNRALEQAGLLARKPPLLGMELPLGDLSTRLKDAALTRLPPALRERIFRAAGTRLPSWLESRVRFGQLAMVRTQAFSAELTYFPAVHLNLEGREPSGRVAPAQVDAVTRHVQDALGELRNPDSGQAAVRAVHRREDVFRGPYLERAPDLIVELALLEHRGERYSYNLMPSASAPRELPADACFGRLAPDAYLGRKGRSLAGSHRRHGLDVAAGPRVEQRGEIAAHIADASATVLARMGVAPPPEASGRVLPLGRGLGAEAISAPALPPAPPPRSAQDAGDEARVAARLRNLGYIE